MFVWLPRLLRRAGVLLAGFIQTWENNILNWTFRNQTVTQPSTIWVALYTTAPTDTSAGTEVSGGAYARQSVTFGAPSGNPAQISNSSQILFPEATASWGTIVAAALHSASSGGGNMIAWANLTTSKTIAAGDQAVFNTGGLVVQLD